ncbi:SDR family NAD(P)-dependent oxidoreductase [uncultured Tateyamaria sp.]|uniref:SDR family NAD(P)-dependent oxidoreductase n=1 Tax=uncultured Tateyamaria sp. TaxID=455651 RepID=UPI002622DC71|nr:SDR family NAD(P)-dependent oxidoreductase [uncultured Tateyamaria sp.]
MHILITGATRGIGAGLANAYRAQGHEVTGTGRSSGAEVTLDVTQPADHRAMAQHLDGRPIDLLVCNAGVYLDKGNDLETGYAPDLWSQTFAANVTGVFLTIQTLLPNLRAAPAPRIAIISSQMASHTHAPGGSYIYRASKAAVLNVGRNLASELAGEVAVGIYHPGWVQTDMGGSSAAITVDEAVTGLMDRFAALSHETTGCFETWDGRAHAY